MDEAIASRRRPAPAGAPDEAAVISVTLMPVVAVFNQKGGVGKTTTALNIAAALAGRGRQPVAIDLDPQAHLTLALALRNVPAADSVYAFFKDGRPLSELVRRSACGAALVPASPDLTKIEALHAADVSIAPRLKEGIEQLEPRGPALLDCSPAMGVLSLNALVAADRVLLPVSADYLSVEGANRLSAALDVLESRLGKRFVRRIVVTRFDARRRLAFDIQAMLRERFGGQVCDTLIKENVALAESPMHGQDIFAFAAHSQGAGDYRALTEELEGSNFFASPAPATAGAAQGG
jgi:chromosome partitioning protein